MNNFDERQNEVQAYSSMSSDEKVNNSSILSSDYEETQNRSRNNSIPNGVLRLSEPEKNDNVKTKLKPLRDANDSLVSKMSNLSISTPPRPRNLGVSPPRLSSMLTSTTNHPLMGLSTPDDNYPDLIPKKLQKKEDDIDLSLSSIEDDRPNETNGYLYDPQRNTSKNNLYFSENFVTADSVILDSDVTGPPDVARVRRKIVIRLSESPNKSDCLTPPNFLCRVSDNNDSAMLNYAESTKITSHSTPIGSHNIDVPSVEQFHSGVPEWCESPSNLRSLPNFELPIEMSTNISVSNSCGDTARVQSPGGRSSSSAEDRSLYEARVDPRAGCAALRPAGERRAPQPPVPRRKIALPPETRCSEDSDSYCSLESEEEVEPAQADKPESPTQLRDDPRVQSDDETKRSSATDSSRGSPIPEYSAAEEAQRERGAITVASGGRRHTCDMKVIEPYKRVLSHGGYDSSGAALIVFSACHLPDTARPDYRYVMDNLFLYVIWTLERLVTDEYVLVYLHGSAGRRRLPSFHWLHECYKLIDRRLRKSLKHLYLVHPTFWLRSFVIITKPFVSSKFFRKLSYVNSLSELMQLVPVEPNAIPELVKRYDVTRQ